jgi:hypothetical protein
MPLSIASIHAFAASNNWIAAAVARYAVFPRGFPGLVKLRYGVALGSAGEDSSDVSVLLLLLFFELPVSLVPSSLVVSRRLPVARSVVVSSELLVAGEAVALLSP